MTLTDDDFQRLSNLFDTKLENLNKWLDDHVPQIIDVDGKKVEVIEAKNETSLVDTYDIDDELYEDEDEINAMMSELKLLEKEEEEADFQAQAPNLVDILNINNTVTDDKDDASKHKTKAKKSFTILIGEEPAAEDFSENLKETKIIPNGNIDEDHYDSFVTADSTPELNSMANLGEPSAPPSENTPLKPSANYPEQKYRSLASKYPAKYPRSIVWIDLETTGLDKKSDVILEISCFLTTKDLTLIEESGFNLIIYQSDSTLSKMDYWARNHHGKSGLTQKCKEQDSSITISKADELLSNYINKLIFPTCSKIINRSLVLAGSSIWYDRSFIDRDLPKTSLLLGPRMIDVSSLNEIGLRHNIQLMKQRPKKSGKHRAKDDILESIDELRWYTENYLIH